MRRAAPQRPVHAADAIARFENAHVVTEFAQLVPGGQAGHARSKNHDLDPVRPVPDRTGLGPACAPIRSHERMALITSAEPPTSPNCSRKPRLVSGRLSCGDACRVMQPPRNRPGSGTGRSGRNLQRRSAARTWTCRLRDPSVVKSGSSRRFSTSALTEIVLPRAKACCFCTLRSTLRWPGVRRSGSVRGALPKV